MKRLIGATGSCALAVLLLGWSARVASEDAPKLAVPSQATGAAGRFQMTAVGGQLFLLDTSTGQVWKHDPTAKTDEHFFSPKIQTDVDGSTTLGPTYRGKSLNYWLALLRDTDPNYQEHGMEAICHYGEQAKVALPDLLRMFLKNMPDRSDEGITYCIAQIDPRHNELHALLGHKDIALRRAAAVAMAVLGNVDPDRHPGRAVVELQIQSEDEGEPAGEPQFKWRLPKDKDAIPVLIEMLKDREPVKDDFSFATVALSSLATFKTDAASAAPEVTKLLADKNANLRQLSVMVLGAIAPTARDTLTAARAALKDDDPQVRAVGAQVVGQLGDRESLPALKALMKDESPEVRQGVVQAFGSFKGDAETLVPILVEVLRTPESKLRIPVTYKDGRQHEAINNREMSVVAAAYSALGRFGSAAKAAVPELVKQASQSEGMMFTQSARMALKKIAPDEWKKLKPPNTDRHPLAPAGYAPSPTPNYVPPSARPYPR
jgi:HEAT repeat protein